MVIVEDPVRIRVPSGVAGRLAAACSLTVDGHQWSQANVAAAREVLAGGEGCVVAALARRVSRIAAAGLGWAVVALPARLSDEALLRSAAGVLAGVGRPFFSVDAGTGLWVGAESSAVRDQASFGGVGLNGLHVDAPNVEHVPDYTGLMVLRADPAGGGASLVGDLHAALTELDDDDRDELRRPVYSEGRAEGLHGVGGARLPFPVLDDAAGGRPWIRWAAKLLTDDRNAGHRAVLQRFAAGLASHTRAVVLTRGQLLIVDQQRIAHGRTQLGEQAGLAEGSRRWLVQAKVAYDPTAPGQTMPTDIMPSRVGGEDD